MSKVTGKDLEKLIEGALAERVSINVAGRLDQVKQALDLPADSDITKTSITNVADLDRTPRDTLDYDDMLKAYSRKLDGSTGNADALDKISNQTSNPEIKSDWEDAQSIDPEDPSQMGDIKDIDIDAQTYEPSSVAFQQMANIGAQNSDPNQPLGAMPEGLASSVKTFFQGKSTFQERIEAVSNFSTMVFDDQKIEGLSPTSMLAASLFNDYLTTIVTEMDSGTGAYQFEVLLANMAGGSVTGKGDITEATGQAGAVDFLMNDGTAGSAKFYANLDASSITQSVAGFANKKGKSILYVIGHKVSDASLAQTERGTSDPGKITQLNIYLVSVVPLVDKPEISQHFLLHVNGKAVGGVVKKRKLMISDKIGTATPIPIKISAGQTKFKDALATATANSDSKLKEAYKQFQALFSELNDANQKAQRYSSTGDTAAGEAALKGIDGADERMISLVSVISDKTVQGDKGKRQITQEHILKLIEESFKK